MLLPVTIFVALVTYYPWAVSATMTGRWTALSLGAAALSWTVRRPLLGRSHLLGAALLLWAGLSVAWSVSSIDSVGETWHWIVLSVLFLAASQHRDPESSLVALVIGLCASVPFVMLQMLGATPVEATDVPAGLFLSRNAMGEIAACALTWAVARRTWELVPAPLFLVAASGSRGALLACLAGGAVLLWRARARWVTIIGLEILVIVAVAVVTRVRDPSLESILTRLDIWQFAVSDTSITGRGLETFGTIAPELVYAHSDPIQVLFELGVVGLGLSGLFLLRPLRAGTPESTALCAILAASLVSFPLHHPTGAMLVAVLAGYACGTRDRAERSERLLGDCGAARSAYESEPAEYLRGARAGFRVVAGGQEHSVDAGDLARSIQRDGEETRA